jgi:hypothetical protein
MVSEYSDKVSENVDLCVDGRRRLDRPWGGPSGSHPWRKWRLPCERGTPFSLCRCCPGREVLRADLAEDANGELNASASGGWRTRC